MIVSMKKVVVLCRTEDRRRTVDSLGKLGLVHLTEQPVESTDLDEIQSRLDRLDQAMNILGAVAETGVEELPTDHTFAELRGPGSGEILASRILEVDSERRDLVDERNRLQRELERWAPWGELNPDVLEDLAERGLELHLVQLSADQESLLAEIGRAHV